LAFASSWQTGHFASAIWKFLSAFALVFSDAQALEGRTKMVDNRTRTKGLR
jgi:hypothetical protein